jgi:5'-methylthioadenosine phosphorylase
MATDYDCWHESHEDVSVEAILEVMGRNVENARKLVALTAPALARPRSCACASALQNAILTAPDRIPAETRQRLDLLIGKYLSR